MNHETLTQLARLVESDFPQKSIQSMKSTLNDSIRFMATHLPVLSPKSKPEEFINLDTLQKNINKLADMEAKLDKLQSVLEDNG